MARLLILYIAGITAVILVSLFTCYLFFRSKLKISVALLYLFIASSIYMLFMQWLKYLSLHFFIDFSHWLMLLYNIIQSGRPLNMSQEFFYPGTLNYLSAHFVPLIYAFAVPFKLCPRPETIIFLNFILMTSSTIPLYKLASVGNKDNKFSLFMISLLLWYPTFQYTVLYEFEMLRFSIPIIFWLLYFNKTNRRLLYFCFLALAVLIREDVGLSIGMFGIYLAVFEKKYGRGLITFLTGFSVFLLIAQIVMPSLRISTNHSHVANEFFADLGNNFWDVFLNMFRHPQLFLHRILNPLKLANIFMYFLPLLFIPLLSPAVLLSIIPGIIIGLLSSFFNHISYALYYLSPAIPFIFYAFINGWPHFIKRLSLLNFARRQDLDEIGMGMVLSALIVTNIFFGPSPVSLQFWIKDFKPAPFKTQNFHYSTYIITEHSRNAAKMALLIPDDSFVSAQHFLFTSLYKKKGVMIFPKTKNTAGTIEADYIFFDKTNNGLNKESPAYRSQTEFNAIESDTKNWKLMASLDGFYIYKRKK